MLKIRLRRTGAKKQPRYRVVVAESSAPRDGAFVDVLGWYNPQATPTQVVVDVEKAREWIARGAQPSDRVAFLLKRASSTPETEVPAASGADSSAGTAEPTPKRRGSGRRAAAEQEPAAVSVVDTEPAASAVAEQADAGPTGEAETTARDDEQGP